jgi:hypothetical protein
MPPACQCLPNSGRAEVSGTEQPDCGREPDTVRAGVPVDGPAQRIVCTAAAGLVEVGPDAELDAAALEAVVRRAEW